MVERDVLHNAPQSARSRATGVAKAASRRVSRAHDSSVPTPAAQAADDGAVTAQHAALRPPHRADDLGAHLRNAVQQRAEAGPILQRAVGFEFETGWGVRRSHVSRFRKKRKPIKKASVLHPYTGFNLTADETKGGVGAALEWVVDPPVQEGAGRAALDTIMTQLVAEASKLEALHATPAFTLDQATGDHNDAWVEILPTVVGLRAGKGMPANPQVTAGVRLAQMHTMFAELGAPSGGDIAIKQALAQWGAGALNAAARETAKINGSDELKGLVVQLVAYLNTGSWGVLQRGPSKAFEYAKLIGSVMHRTDFATQFGHLPKDERDAFRAKPQDFVNLVLATADDHDGSARVFERGVRKDFRKTPTKQRHVRDFGPTREQWLRGITQGRDMLSSAHMTKQKATLEGLGALGHKVDTVSTNNAAGMVVEFRGVTKEMKLDTWHDFAMNAFDYIVDLNERKSPDELAASEDSDSPLLVSQ